MISGMQRHPENQQHHQHGADPCCRSRHPQNVAILRGNRTGPVSRTPRAEFTGKIEIRGRPA